MKIRLVFLLGNLSGITIGVLLIASTFRVSPVERANPPAQPATPIVMEPPVVNSTPPESTSDNVEGVQPQPDNVVFGELADGQLAISGPLSTPIPANLTIHIRPERPNFVAENVTPNVILPDQKQKLPKGWVPREFNGMVYYIIPLASTEATLLNTNKNATASAVYPLTHGLGSGDVSFANGSTELVLDDASLVFAR